MNSSESRTAGEAVTDYFATTFTALKHTSFRWYCMGVIVSLIGSLMQETVVAWLAYKMTGSSFALGGILFSYQLPMLTLGLLGGWAADKFDRKRIIAITQVIALGISLTWLTLAVTDTLAVWHLYALSAVFGVVVAFEIPARFAMIPQLVEGKDIPNAFSLDSFLFYTGRVVGPAIGALALGPLGAAGCFALNSLSYILELFTISRIKPAPRTGGNSAGLKEAFAFTYGNPEIRRILLFVAVFSFCGVYVPLMPVFTTALGGNSSINGLLIMASELGAVIGSIYLANRTAVGGYMSKLKGAVGYAGISYAGFLTLFSLASSTWVAMLLIIPVGFSMTILLIGSHNLIQEKTEDRMRGVVSTVFWMYSYFGMFALGGPALGYLIDWTNISTAMVVASLACLVTALAYLAFLRPKA